MSSRLDEPARSAPLTRAQAGEVLRYWLASLQLEEALATRPRARRAPATATAIEPRVSAPTPGHDYFKVPFDRALAALVCDEAALHKAFDAELVAFFETWLAAQYRRGDDDRELSHLLAFPVVHLPRGELAGLLRFGVRVRFGAAGGPPFKVPSRSERRRKLYPSAPNEVRLTPLPRSGRAWPFFVDTRLLQQQLGVARESIDALFAALRAEPELDEARMLRMVCELLERELGERPPPTAADAGVPLSLDRITTALSKLLARNAGRARVYPVAVVIDSTRAKTTWYLQRELQLLLEERPDVSWDLDGCLGAYLTGRAAASGSALQRGLIPGPALSASQRHAAEHSWGSRLSAVQGPPGTGKTTLILHMAAEALIRQIDELADRDVMGSGVFVVTSTNNRAVDNVVEPLNAALGTGLPLALRGGSQKACELLLSPQLQAARTWLAAAQRAPAAERSAALARTLAQFRALRAELSELLGPYARACEARQRLSELRLELAESSSDEPPLLEPERVAALYEPLQKVQLRIERLCELCAAPPGLTQLNAIDRHHRAGSKRDLPRLQEALTDAGLTLELGLPPLLPPSTQPAVLMAVWQEAAQNAHAKLEALAQQLVQALGHARSQARKQSLKRELAELERVATARASEPRPQCDALERALFEAAVATREAWAAAQGDELLRTVDGALAAARGDSSLRPLFSEDSEAWQQLKQLFGVWGCTLLSLGNCFPAEQHAIARVVIDEAGQCHPAYAVSALVRSRTALIIGDVHQLEPVIDLEPADDERVVQACKLTLDPAQLVPYRIHNEARCSVQALADRAVLERPRLTDHFRCQPEIIAICDALCAYGLQVHTPRQGPAVPIAFLREPVSLIGVAGEQERVGGSWYNAAELAVTVELLQAILHTGLDPNDVAIITPYRGQLEHLQKQLQRAGIALDYSLELSELEATAANASGGGVALGTVHRFQGGERSIVIFSSVVTRRASLRFLDQREHLLNVAVSRARHRFITVGDPALLATGTRTALLVSSAVRLAPDDFRLQLRLA